jgi:uncharacterized CHY-type Zn-finger protein
MYQVGQPLAKNGCCKHMKNSFRHFRFDCCDTVYPCPKCHDGAADHE